MKQPSLWDDTPASIGLVEQWASSMGLWPVLGVDEVGRGCLAGPVVAAAVILDEPIPGLNDSKLLTSPARERLAPEIQARARAVAISAVDVSAIDSLNILRATLLAMRKACEGAMSALCGPVGIVVVDGTQAIPQLDLPQRPWPKGDRLSWNCAAASIVAKVHRDHLMEELDSLYPGYGFAVNKGYGTAQHLEALLRLGPSPVHRMSFAPCRAARQKASSITLMSASPSLK